jgi:signal transduction histidine kinase
MARAVVIFRNNAVELAHSRHGLVQQATMLEERLEAEQRLTSLQRNFVSMASHELRTPLTIIDGQAQRLFSLRERLSPEIVAERIGSIRAAVRRMTHSMEHLLNSSRLFDGDASLYFHPVSIDPAALLHKVCQLYREISPGARIVERLNDLPPIMFGDPNLLHQAFSNLFSNAIKYSPDRALVKLTARVEADWLVVEVEDHGLGIPRETVVVLDRYHRGSNVTGIVGTGLTSSRQDGDGSAQGAGRC